MGIILSLLGALTLLLFGLGIILAIVLLVYTRWHYGKLDNLGFPVIKPHLFLGSSPNAHNEIVHRTDLDRSKKYGKVYGAYDGRVPTIFITDPEIIRLIQTRDFEHFRNHRKFLNEIPITSELLDFLDDEKWKTIRSMLTPNFTTGKIKKICQTVSEISADYIGALLKEEFKDQDRLKIDFRKYCPPYIFEIIGKCFCGIDIQNARDPNNQFIKTIKEAMGGDEISFDWTFTYVNALPILMKVFPSLNHDALREFENIIRTLINNRENSDTEAQDFINTLKEIVQKSKSDPLYKKLGIGESTAIAQAFEFFIASFEANRSTLALLFYHLSLNPDTIQQKVLNEVDQALKKTNGKINWETISEMPYLTASIYETLRINPSFFRIDRRCTKDWEYKGNDGRHIKIKEGMFAIFPIFALHHDEDFYPNPDKFEPERFLPENKDKMNSYAFQAFGMGPRACIGQRFAIDILKTVLVHFLREFRIEKRKDTVFIEHLGNPFFITHDPIYVDFVRRR